MKSSPRLTELTVSRAALFILFLLFYFNFPQSLKILSELSGNAPKALVRREFQHTDSVSQS